jgi:hypothetical protein
MLVSEEYERHAAHKSRRPGHASGKGDEKDEAMMGFLFGSDPFPKTLTYSSVLIPGPSLCLSCEHMLVTIIPRTSYFYGHP